MKRNSGWIWYFVIVVVLGALGTVWLVDFNLRLQLKHEPLAANKALWDANKPADYDLVYTIKMDDETQGVRYTVRVRANKLVYVLEQGVELAPEQAARHTMDALFDLLHKYLDADGVPGAAKVYARARFHDANGAILEYVRRIMRTRQRLEIAINRFRFGPDLTEGQDNP